MKRVFVLMVLIANAQAGEWGRLFFYPPKPEPPPVVSEPARFDGVLEGRSKTYWVDGVATRRAPPVQVKPGEAWDRQSGAPQPGPRMRRP